MPKTKKMRAAKITEQIVSRSTNFALERKTWEIAEDDEQPSSKHVKVKMNPVVTVTTKK